MKSMYTDETVIEEYHFSPTKYEALGFQRPAGLQLLKMVEDSWLDWIVLVEKAFWINWWGSSSYVEQLPYGRTPQGRIVNKSSKYSNVALRIFTTAVWGYGIVGWLRGQKIETETKAESNAEKLMHSLRGDSVNLNKFDRQIFFDLGIYVPTEIGTLDRWLEPLWRKAKDQTKWDR